MRIFPTLPSMFLYSEVSCLFRVLYRILQKDTRTIEQIGYVFQSEVVNSCGAVLHALHDPVLLCLVTGHSNRCHPECRVTGESRKAWNGAWLISAPERTGKHQTEREASLVLARNYDMRAEKNSSRDEKRHSTHGTFLVSRSGRRYS